MLQQCCSRTTLIIHTWKYSGADEVQVDLELNEDLGRPWRPPKMNAGDPLNGGKGSSNSSQLSQELTQEVSVLCALLGSPGTFLKQPCSPLVCFGSFFLIFTVYGLCELPTRGKIKVNQIFPFNSDQRTQFREVSHYNLKKLLPACRVFHGLCWCILYISSNSTATTPTYNSWYSHKYFKYYLFSQV